MQLQLSDYGENINVIICEIITLLFKDTICNINTVFRFADILQHTIKFPHAGFWCQ